MQDGTILIWDLWPQMWTPTGVANNKGGNDLDGLWADLADPDAGQAYRAICTLSAAPAQAIAFLADRLLRRTGCMNWEQVQSLVQMQIDYWRAVGRLECTQALEQCLAKAERCQSMQGIVLDLPQLRRNQRFE